MLAALKFQSTPLIRGATQPLLLLAYARLISIHAPHTRGDTCNRSSAQYSRYFNPRPSYEGRRDSQDNMRPPRSISIHAPHTRGDAQRQLDDERVMSFQSTPLIRGATWSPISGRCLPCYFNPRPSYEGRPRSCTRSFSRLHFNPRPSYEGRPMQTGTASRKRIFQSTPLIRGATRTLSTSSSPVLLFQSTPLIRGATHPRPVVRQRLVDFNPRPSYEGRPQLSPLMETSISISIHAPHTRGDCTAVEIGLSTSISIHAPHTRGDRRCKMTSRVPFNFNPRPSYEGRHTKSLHDRIAVRFQSTPLIRGATDYKDETRLRYDDFNPRPSYEGRPDDGFTCETNFDISIHAPHTRGDSTISSRSSRVSFQSTPLIRGATGSACLHSDRSSISIHAPHTRGDSLLR